LTFFTEIGKSILKFIWKHKRLSIDKAILRRKTNAGGIKVPEFRLYTRDIVTKMAWYWYKTDRQISSLEDPEKSPHS
jgi:hypothetical protein